MTSLTLKKSVVQDKVPLLSDLDYGELAINYRDGKIFYKRSDGNPQNDTIDFFVSGQPAGTTYSISAETDPAGAALRLTGSDNSTDNVILAAGTNVTLTRTDANTISIAATGGSGQGAAYSISAETDSSGAALRLRSGDGTPGELTEVSSATPTTSAIVYTVVAPNAKFLYGRTNNGIKKYSINNETGELTQISADTNTIIDAGRLAITPDSNFLYCANFTNQISKFSIASTTGELSVIGSTTSVGNPSNQFIIQALITPNGNFLYVLVENSSNSIAKYKIESNGELTQISSFTPTGSTPSKAFITPDNKYLYCLSTSSTISKFSINATSGELSLISSATSITSTANDIAITPDSKYLYCTSSSGTIFKFTIETNGELTAIGTPTSAGTSPSVLHVVPNGTYLYCTNPSNYIIRTFKIESNGELTEKGTFTTGTFSVREIVSTTDSRFLYTFHNGRISKFSISESTGLLTEISPWITVGTDSGSSNNPQRLVITSNNKFVYCTQSTALLISKFKVDITSTADDVVFAAGNNISLSRTDANTITINSTAGGGVDIQHFTTVGSSTWTKPLGAKLVYVQVWGGGGGGGSGRRRSIANQNSANASGGSGGSGGGYTWAIIPAVHLGSTVSVEVGAGGAGAGFPITDDTNGGAGTSGGTSRFAVIYGNGGPGGIGGGSSTQTSQPNGASSQIVMISGANSFEGRGGTGTSSFGTTAQAGTYGGGGGGGGAGFSTGSTSANNGGGGGQGNRAAGITVPSSTQPGFAVSNSAGGAGARLTIPTNWNTLITQIEVIGGGGGAGGSVAAFTSGAASAPGTAGGLGGWPGGGGGGGSASQGADSGPGGNGREGYVRVTTFL